MAARSRTPPRAAIRRCYADTSMGQLHYRRAGEGPCILLLAQTGRSSQMFCDLIGALAGRFRVMAPDMPGCGASGALPSGAGIADMAGLCVELLDAEGVDRADVYGIHSGNKIAAALAVRHPRRVRRLAIAGQSHSLIPDRAERNRVIAGGKGGVQTLEDGPVARLLGLVEAIRRWRADGAAADDGDLASLLETAADELQALRTTADVYRMNFAHDFGADLARLTQPTLIIEIVTPQEDALVARQGPALAGIVADARIAEIEERDGRGLTLETRSAELAALLDGFFGGSP